MSPNHSDTTTKSGPGPKVLKLTDQQQLCSEPRCSCAPPAPVPVTQPAHQQPSSTPQTNPTKSHKVEGKNKKSLHHKQQAQRNQASLDRQQSSHPPAKDSQQQSAGGQKQKQEGSRRQKSASGPANINKITNQSANINPQPGPVSVCVTLDDFYKKAQELKADIQRSLEKAAANKTIDRPIEVVKLKEDILKLAGITAFDDISGDSKTELAESAGDAIEASETTQVQQQQQQQGELCSSSTDNTLKNVVTQPNEYIEKRQEQTAPNEESTNDKDGKMENSTSQKQKQDNLTEAARKETIGEESSDVQLDSETKEVDSDSKGYKSDVALNLALNNLTLNQNDSSSESPPSLPQEAKNNTKNKKAEDNNKKFDVPHLFDDNEPNQATLDEKTKFCALMAAFKTQFEPAPHLLEPICRQLAYMSDQKWQLQMKNEQYQAENQRLLVVKQKLENLCRELQKSNNAIRCESLELIKAEQGKAKAQTTKIQSTLSGVIKLFDENQQRNMTLRQENQELQTKLKSLLEHCDNCEKSVETALRQRDIENRLLKTELAKANLSKNEEKEKFLGEKQELLQILSMMQEQQHRIEGQEAKLRSDLSSYASKYDECQAVINKGMNRFQTESKKMLKTIEKSKQDYKVLLAKYEASNKKMSQLLEEKQYWDKTLALANKKIETLEKLCRALRDNRKQAELVATNGQKKANKTKQTPPKVTINITDDAGRADDNVNSLEALDLSLNSVVQETANET